MAAARSPFAAVLRRWCASINSNPTSHILRSLPLLSGEASYRFLSSGPLEEDFPLRSEGDLKSRIFRLRFPKRSATDALERWIAEGGKVSAPELRQITRDLRRAQRYKHALEILSWMESKHTFRLLASDHARRLELITIVQGLAEGEAYFNKIEDSASKKAACLPLLNCYVKGKNMDRAEILMEKLRTLGLLVTPQPFNEMMKLYFAAGQYEKVQYVVKQMKQGNISQNVLSYNLWLNACSEVSDISSVETVFKEMTNDRDVEVGWSTYATLANIYTKSGLHDKAFVALRSAEAKLSAKNRLGYFFLITLYSNLFDRDGVIRLWESSKKVEGRITSVNYMCIMLCLVKVDDIEEAERVFRTWESVCRKYDIRVSNVLLGAYVRKGWMDKAELLHTHTLEKGGIPNYKTWEILMEGWVKSNMMDKAVEAMKKGFSMLKGCHWRPPSTITMAILQYFEDQHRAEDAKKYVRVLRRLNIMNMPLYKSFIRTHIRAEMPAPNFLKMMERDKVDLDEEAWALIRCASQLKDIRDSNRGLVEVEVDR